MRVLKSYRYIRGIGILMAEFSESFVKLTYTSFFYIVNIITYLSVY